MAIKVTEVIGTPASILVHTALFIVAFLFYFGGVPFDTILLVLTTIVSLEAIYLSLFIQLSVNKNTESLEEVEEDIGEIQEDVQGLEGEFDEIQEDVDELQEDVEEISDDDDMENSSAEQRLQELQKQLEDAKTQFPTCFGE